MTIDYHATAERLARPWWGLKEPESYVIRGPDGRTLGIGLLIHSELQLGVLDTYGTWNISLLVRGSTENPKTREGHLEWCQMYQTARKLGAITFLGQPLSSYAMLRSARAFVKWTSTLPSGVLSDGDKRWFLTQYQALLKREPTL